MSTYTPALVGLAANYYQQDFSLGSPDGTATPNLNIYNGNAYISGITQSVGGMNISTSVQATSITGTNGITGNVGGLISLTSSTNAIALTSSTSTVTVTSSTTAGQITLASAGLVGSNGSVFINATNATSGTVNIVGAGNVAGAVTLNANGGTTASVLLSSTGIVNVQPTTGLNLATTTSGVPITIGNNSIVTISGQLLATGGLTRINTTVTDILDNFVTVNAGGTTAGLDSGYAMRSYQVPNDTGVGDVVTGRIQETGTIGTGSTTTTIVLGPTASTVDGTYNGDWIRNLTSNAVRRIKTYVGATKTATIYATADNTNTAAGIFQDGLDFLSSSTSGQVYNIYSNPFNAMYYNTSSIGMINASFANSPDSSVLTTASIQQYLPQTSGKYISKPLTFANQSATASGTTISVTTPGGALTLTVGRLIRITASTGFTPSIPTGTYTILTNASNVVTFTVPATTTNAANSTVALTCLETSAISADYIFGNSLTSPIISGFPLVTAVVVLTQNSVTPVTITPNTSQQGCYTIMVSSVVAGGSCCWGSRVKAQATDNNNAVTGSISTTSGSSTEKVAIVWNASSSIQIYHQKIFSSGSASVSYNVTIMYAGTY